ncbi:FAD-binding protein [Deltaproteobacteria bacterium]|nr:FAD-binding protein [Deltaproteobacteria bacterium]
MDLYSALIEKRIPVTKELVNIVDGCSLCGICDKQCHFVTGLRPLTVMEALKNHVRLFLEDGNLPEESEPDEFLLELQSITGEKWASSDPAISLPYADDPCPVSPSKMPRYVVLPAEASEISKIVKLCGSWKMPYSIRGNGSSVMGFVMSDGLVMDMNRMKGVRFDEKNWCVYAQPGVAAFDLQKEAVKRGYRVNVAEPSALVAANIMCSGIFSNFSHSYGTLADNYVNAEFVAPDGIVFNLNQPEAPNLFSYLKEDKQSPGICTEVGVKLYPLPEDEEGLLVPFSNMEKAISFAAELGRRRIGNAVGVLGGEYLSVFVSPSEDLAHRLKDFFTRTLGIKYAVLVLADKYDREIISRIAETVIGQKLFTVLMLGLPNLEENEGLKMIEDYAGDREPYEMLCDEKVLPLLESLIKSSPDTLAQSVPEDLRDFYKDLYSRPEMTNMVWLSMFRIISSRMGRHKHAVAYILYVPMDNIPLIMEIDVEFRRIAQKHGIHNDFGFITPLDMGKRGVFEYDYYVDHTNDEEKEKCLNAMAEVAEMIEGFSVKTKGVKWIRYTLYQGFCRSENLLYLD